VLALARAIYILRDELDVRYAASLLAEYLAQRPVNDSDLVRDVFSATVLDLPPLVEGHTHPTAACLRTSATNFARLMSNMMGAGLFSVGMSRSDQRKLLRGSRKWFWAKDTLVKVQWSAPTPRDLEYICDVDYYVDMPSLLSGRAKPTLLYTVVPESAASTSEDDTSFCFLEDGSLDTIVAGGGHYNHHLWDYGADSIMVKNCWLGVLLSVTTYAIERRQVGRHRQLVLLTPIKKFVGLAAWIAVYIIEDKPLSRFYPIVRGVCGTPFVRFRIHSSENTWYTTSRPGGQLCATVDAQTDEAISAVSRLSTTNLMLPTTVSWLGKEKRAEAALLTEYYRATGPAKVPTVYPVSQAVRAYTFEPKEYDQDRKPKLEAFMSPLVHGAYAPVADAAGERRCVDGRINNLKKQEPKPSPFVMRCMEEFAELIVGETVLSPVCVDTVTEKQTRPQQKLSLMKACLTGPYVARILKCFIKAEAYQKCADPRNISTYNDRDKLTMAQFALALSKHLKKFEWYGPGKTPIEIAQRVADICSDASMVNVSDYHRMDGTITYVLRQVDRFVFMKAFPDHRTELNELLNTNAGNTGVLPNGTTFEQGPSHGSGCSATSTSQTLRAAFAAYLGFRNAIHAGGAKYSAEQAFRALGIHLGDDGLDADLPIINHEWSARKVGLILEASTVLRGDRGVTFLARYYSPDVWCGRLDSMCDVRRQLSKLHTTVRLPFGVAPETKLVEKAMGYLATDGNTPVIGELCQKAVELSPEGERRRKYGLASCWSQFDAAVQFPNENGDGWMDAEFLLQFPEFDRLMFDDWITSVRTIGDLMDAPLCAEPEQAPQTIVEVVIDGDVMPARCAEADKVPQSPASSSGQARRPTSARRRKPKRNISEGTSAKGSERGKTGGSGPSRVPSPIHGANGKLKYRERQKCG